jgi:hypothetical protein
VFLFGVWGVWDCVAGLLAHCGLGVGHIEGLGGLVEATDIGAEGAVLVDLPEVGILARVVLEILRAVELDVLEPSVSRERLRLGRCTLLLEGGLLGRRGVSQADLGEEASRLGLGLIVSLGGGLLGLLSRRGLGVLGSASLLGLLLLGGRREAAAEGCTKHSSLCLSGLLLGGGLCALLTSGGALRGALRVLLIKLTRRDRHSLLAGSLGVLSAHALEDRVDAVRPLVELLGRLALGHGALTLRLFANSLRGLLHKLCEDDHCLRRVCCDERLNVQRTRSRNGLLDGHLGNRLDSGRNGEGLNGGHGLKLGGLGAWGLERVVSEDGF